MSTDTVMASASNATSCATTSCGTSHTSKIASTGTGTGTDGTGSGTFQSCRSSTLSSPPTSPPSSSSPPPPRPPRLKFIKFNPHHFSVSVAVLLERANTFAQAYCADDAVPLVDCPGFRCFFEHCYGIPPEAVGAGAAVVNRLLKRQTMPVLPLVPALVTTTTTAPQHHATARECQLYPPAPGEAIDLAYPSSASAWSHCCWVIASEMARKVITRDDRHAWGTASKRVHGLTKAALEAAGFPAGTRLDLMAAEILILRNAGWKIV